MIDIPRGTPIPKPEPLKRARARKARQFDQARRACILAVWRRAGDACEECGARVHLSHTDFRKVGHVHERRSRALGGDATNPDHCVLLCHACHFDGPSGAHRRSEKG